MENTEEIEIEIDDIGTILKSGRLKSKRTLEEISSELCIRKIYLTALEEGDYETLPPIPYGVGYVRTYARYLGLSPERAVKLYKAAYTVEDQASEEETPPTPEANKSNTWHIIIGILALAAIYGIWNLYTLKTSSKEIAEVTPKEAVLTEDAVVEEPENVADGAQEETATEDKTAKEDVKEEETKEPDNQEKADQKADEKTEVIPQKGLYLAFTGETWVELKDKNKVYMQGVFHKGDKKTIDYRKNMFISIGRPQNIRLYVNGVNKDVLAKKRKSNIPLDSI